MNINNSFIFIFYFEIFLKFNTYIGRHNYINQVFILYYTYKKIL